MVKKVGKNEFKAETQGIALVDFYADWCGPCRMVSPIVEELANSMTDVNFLKVNVDDDAEIANLFGIRSIPTLVLFKSGEEVDRVIGFMPKNRLENFINKHK